MPLPPQKLSPLLHLVLLSYSDTDSLLLERIVADD